MWTTLRIPPRTPQPVPPTLGHCSLTKREAIPLLHGHELVVVGVDGSGAPRPGLHHAVAGFAVVLSAEEWGNTHYEGGCRGALAACGSFDKH